MAAETIGCVTSVAVPKDRAGARSTGYRISKLNMDGK